MTNRRSSAIFAGLAVLVVGMLAGCGKKEDAADTTAPPAPPPSAGGAMSATPGAGVLVCVGVIYIG